MLQSIKGGDYVKTIILSDIHANEPALTAVLEDAGQYDRLVFLGDLANFGPHPASCVDILRRLDAICIAGNHDELIANTPKHFWDKWSKARLDDAQQEWLRALPQTQILDGHILLLHGSYTVDYDILPTTPDHMIEQAFKDYLTDGIDEVWFGHYHYGVDRTINGVTYRCIRPVGHHRDKDTRAGYSVYEDGQITHKRVEYNLQKTLDDFLATDAFEDHTLKMKFADFLKNAYHEEILKKDIEQMKIDTQKAE